MTQFEITTSAVASAIGRCSISPSRNSTLVTACFAALVRASLTMSVLMSTPITRPVDPDGARREEAVEAAAGAEIERRSRPR